MNVARKHRLAAVRMVEAALVVGLAVWAVQTGSANDTTGESVRAERWFHYTNEVIDEIPWSIHVVRLDRSSRDFEPLISRLFHPTCGDFT